MSKVTIEELEAILNDDEEVPIAILPNGEVREIGYTGGTIDHLLEALQLDVKLTDRQTEAFASLDWILGLDTNSMKTGRTTVLALHAIKAAMDNPGTRIGLRDHDTSPSGQTHMGRVVRDLLHKVDSETRSRFRIGRYHIAFVKRVKLEEVHSTNSVGKNEVGNPYIDFSVSGVIRTGRCRSDRPNRSLAEVQALSRWPYGGKVRWPYGTDD